MEEEDATFSCQSMYYLIRLDDCTNVNHLVCNFEDIKWRMGMKKKVAEAAVAPVVAAPAEDAAEGGEQA